MQQIEASAKKHTPLFIALSNKKVKICCACKCFILFERVPNTGPNSTNELTLDTLKFNTVLKYNNYLSKSEQPCMKKKQHKQQASIYTQPLENKSDRLIGIGIIILNNGILAHKMNHPAWFFKAC